MTKRLYAVESKTLDNKIDTDLWCNTLVLNFGKSYNRSGYAFSERDGKMFIMLESTCISHKSDAEKLRIDLIQKSHPIKSGDFIFVDGKLCKVSILGEYSDAGRLNIVENGPSLEDFKLELLRICIEKSDKHITVDDHFALNNLTKEKFFDAFDTGVCTYIMEYHKIEVEDVLENIL